MAAAILLPSIHYPDEVFQSLEQAYRAVFGYGLVPWEFRDGARSWLLPGLLSAPMWLGAKLAPGSDAYRYLAQGSIAALSSLTVVVGYWWARRFSRWHSLLAAVVLGTWFELVYFGAKALGEVVASCFLFAGVFLCSGRPDAQRTGRALLAGVALGCAFVFRFHLAPAIALAALWRCRVDFRNGWLPLLMGASIPLLVLGLTDWATWSVPFGSIINNFMANIVEGRSRFYGTSSPGWYAGQFVAHWGGAIAVIGPLALWGSRRQPLPLLVSLVIVLSHSAIAHKEYRFVYPAIPLILFCASLGSAELCRWLASVRRRPTVEATAAIACGVAWLIGSSALAVSDVMRPEWSRGRGGLELMSRAGSSAQCGVALMVAWSWTGGYSSLHQKLPIHLLSPYDPGDWDTGSFDAWIGPAGMREPVEAGFRLVQCSVQNAGGVADICLWTRDGPCSPGSTATEAQRVLESTGQ